MSGTSNGELSSNELSMNHQASNPLNPGNDATSATTMVEKAAPVLNVPIQSIVWTKVVELCYRLSEDSTTTSNGGGGKRSNKCFSCGKLEDVKTSSSVFKFCGKCQVAKYCSRECQIQDWKTKQHKRACPSYQRMIYKSCASSTEENLNSTNDTNSDHHNADTATLNTNKFWTLRSEEMKYLVRNELFGKVRFYVCPYAVTRYNELGRGFIFLQMNQTLDYISLLSIPLDCDGYPIVANGNIIQSFCSVHYLTMGEYDQEVCRNDFEMTIVRNELQDAILQYNPLQQIVVLMKFICGHIAVGTTSLVPDYKLCQHLGRDYIDPNTGSTMGSLQLNLDE